MFQAKNESRLTFLYRTTRDKYYNWRAMYKCSCGNVKEIQMSNVSHGSTISCGCVTKERLTTHGCKNHPLMPIWHRMKSMCYNRKNKSYTWYGGAGIIICDEWLNSPNEFISWCLENGWRKGLEIDRENTYGNYEPTNCRFVTHKINCNNRRNSRTISFNGETKNLCQWAEELNMSWMALDRRLKRGWSIEQALTIPIIKEGSLRYARRTYNILTTQ